MYLVDRRASRAAAMQRMNNSVQVGYCHHCSIRFANPAHNQHGQYFCPRCGGYAVEILDSVPMQLLQQPEMNPNQTQIFQEFVNGILATMPSDIIQSLQDNNDHPPTSEAAIAGFDRKVFDPPPEDPCVVCQDDINAGEELLVLPCGHFFHPDCVTPWLRKNNTCPNCRFELPTECVPIADRERNYENAQRIFRQRLVAALQGDDRYRNRTRGTNLTMQEQMAQRRQHHNRVREVRGILGITRQQQAQRQSNRHHQVQQQAIRRQEQEQENQESGYTCFSACTIL